MTQHIERLIIGSGSIGLGALLSDPTHSLLVERSATIIPEANGAFEPGNWDGFSCTQELSQDLADELRQRHILTERGLHLPGLAAVLWSRLKPLQQHCRFMTEILDIKKNSDYYIVDLHNVGGHTRLHCDEIIDCSDTAHSQRTQQVTVLKRALHLNLHHPDGGSDLSHISNCTPGAFTNEAILRIPLAYDCDWHTARRTVHQQWLQRSSALHSWQCVAIANAFALEVTPLGSLDERWLHMPACNSRNVLAGMEQGQQIAKATTHV